MTSFQKPPIPPPDIDTDRQSDTRIRVLLVDDHPLVRAGLVSVVRSCDRLEVVGEASSGPEATELCQKLHPDIVLMDIRMPGGSGLDACRWIKNRLPAVKVVFLTSYGDDECLVNAISAGADGYILKSIEGSDLVGSLLKVALGGSYADPMVTQRLFARISTPEKLATANMQPSGTLTSTFSVLDSQIMDRVAQGLVNKEIASDLGIAEKSVRNRLTKIFLKLEASNRTQASDIWRRVKCGEWEHSSSKT